MKSPEPWGGATTRGADDRWIDDPPTTTHTTWSTRVDWYGCATTVRWTATIGPARSCSYIRSQAALHPRPAAGAKHRALVSAPGLFGLSDRRLPPGAGDAWRGFDAYVNGDLARAVECVRRRESVARISLVGCCFGGLLSVITRPASRHRSSSRPVRVPVRDASTARSGRRRVGGAVLRNAPAWMIRAGLNASLPGRVYLASYLAQDLGESELARSVFRHRRRSSARCGRG